MWHKYSDEQPKWLADFSSTYLLRYPNPFYPKDSHSKYNYGIAYWEDCHWNPTKKYDSIDDSLIEWICIDDEVL